MEDMENAVRFLNAYASIERSLNRLLNKNDYVPFKKLVSMAAKNNAVVAKNEEILKEYSDLRNAIVHQRARTEEIIAQPVDSVVENIERIAELLDVDESVITFATKPVTIADETTTVEEAYELLHAVGGEKLPIYAGGQFVGIVTMDQIAGWNLGGGSSTEQVRKLIGEESPETVFMKRTQSIMEAVLLFDRHMKQTNRAPVILVTETGDMHEEPLGILSTHDLSRILAALI